MRENATQTGRDLSERLNPGMEDALNARYGHLLPGMADFRSVIAVAENVVRLPVADIQPYFIMAAGVCAAETDEEAWYLRSSQMLAFARLRTGRPGKLPHPVADLSAEIGASEAVAFLFRDGQPQNGSARPCCFD